MKKQPPQFLTLMTRVKPPLSTEFTEWRRRQPEIPAIADAVRELMRKGLAADGGVQQPTKKSA